jgi:hypothetical protein
MNTTAHAASALGFLAVLTLAPPAAAQVTPEWRAVHPGPAGAEVFAGHAATDPLGNILVTFEAPYAPGGPATELAKYSPNGQLLWLRRPLPIFAVGLVSSANGDVVLCGNAGGGLNALVVLRLDAQGRLRWRRAVAGAVAQAMVLDALDQAVVVGSAGGDWLVQPFASDGTSPWVRHLDGPQHLLDSANCVSIDAAGDLLVGGSVGTSGGYTDAAVAKLSGAGQLQWMSDWSATYDRESYSSIVSDGQGGAIAAGTVDFTWTGSPPLSFVNHQITHFDASGHLAWLHPSSGLMLNSAATDVVLDGSGQIWAAIHIDPYAFSTPSVQLERIGSNGQTLSTFEYDGPTHAGAWPVGLQLDDAGRVLVGACSGDPFTGANDLAVLLRMDAIGTPAWTETFAAPGVGLRAAGIRRAPGQRVLLLGDLIGGSGFESDALVIQLGLSDPPAPVGASSRSPGPLAEADGARLSVAARILRGLRARRPARPRRPPLGSAPGPFRLVRPGSEAGT